MCFDRNVYPGWFILLKIIFGPLLLLILNMILINNEWFKGTKKTAIILSILSSLIWMYFWYVDSIATKCI